MKSMFICLILILSALSVHAQTALETTPIIPTVEYSVTVEAKAPRPTILPALYVSQMSLQAYDAYSTLTVLRHGGSEANPLMKAATNAPVAFVALKAGTAAMTIIAAEQLWKRGNKAAAIGVMVASNVTMAVVARHNYGVVSQLH